MEKQIIPKDNRHFQTYCSQLQVLWVDLHIWARIIRNNMYNPMECDSRQNSTLNSVLHTFHFVTQIVFCVQIVKIKFYFVFQILFCFELCSLNSVLLPKFYFTLNWQFA